MLGIEFIHVIGAASDSKYSVVVTAEERDRGFVGDVSNIPVTKEFCHIVEYERKYKDDNNTEVYEEAFEKHFRFYVRTVRLCSKNCAGTSEFC